MNVALGSDDAVGNLHLAGRPDELAAGGAGQIAGFPDGGIDAQLTGVGEGHFHLGFRAHRAQDGHFQGTLGAHYLYLLIGGELAGLREVFFMAEDGALAEQGLQILLGDMQMTCGSFYHYLQWKHLLL